MGFLDKLFGRKGDRQTVRAKEDEAIADIACPHGSLVPHWDQLGDMGKTDAVSYYTCESCDQRFSGEQGQRLMSEAAAGVPVRGAGGAPPAEGRGILPGARKH